MAESAESALTSLRVELEEAKELIAKREAELLGIQRQIANAQIRKRELDALRSAALVDHLRKHAEAAEQARALESCSKAIQVAWARIKELHAHRAEVSERRAVHERADTHLKRLKLEHAEASTHVEASWALNVLLLERE